MLDFRTCRCSDAEHDAADSIQILQELLISSHHDILARVLASDSDEPAVPPP